VPLPPTTDEVLERGVFLGRVFLHGWQVTRERVGRPDDAGGDGGLPHAGELVDPRRDVGPVPLQAPCEVGDGSAAALQGAIITLPRLPVASRSMSYCCGLVTMAATMASSTACSPAWPRGPGQAQQCRYATDAAARRRVWSSASVIGAVIGVSHDTIADNGVSAIGHMHNLRFLPNRELALEI